MKVCQLCGAKSWGTTLPSRPLVAGAQELFVGQYPRSLFIVCDNCGSFAAKALLEDDPAPNQAESGVLGKNPFALANEVMRNIMPAPETRTERLLRTLLNDCSLDIIPLSKEDAQTLVNSVRTLEEALDRD